MGERLNYIITVSGLVQGVGFRPFIYRLANESGLEGWVLNTNENVRIGLRTDPASLDLFIDRVRQQAPPASEIGSISVELAPLEDFAGFRIIESEKPFRSGHQGESGYSRLHGLPGRYEGANKAH